MQIIFFLGQNVHDLSVQSFQKARIIELMTTLTLTVRRHHENKTIFVCSYANFFCSFVKALMRWVPKFFMEVTIYVWFYTHLRAICVMASSEQKNSICLNADLFCFFEKLLLIWLQGIHESSHHWSYNHVDLYCLIASSK